MLRYAGSDSKFEECAFLLERLKGGGGGTPCERVSSCDSERGVGPLSPGKTVTKRRGGNGAITQKAPCYSKFTLYFMYNHPDY